MCSIFHILFNEYVMLFVRGGEKNLVMKPKKRG